jgi:hypothetical protein
MGKLSQVSKYERERVLDYQKERLLTENLVKHLHSHARFFIENVNVDSFLNIDLLSTKPKKLFIESDILKVFCEIFDSDTKNQK